MSEDLYVKLYKDRTFADVTFVLHGEEVKAHKCVLADRCDYCKEYFNQHKSNVVNMEGTSFKLFKEVVKFCYLQQIDLSDWSYEDKECLHELATEYKYGPMMDFVKRELDKRPEVPLRVDTLNEWYKNSPGEELRGWIKSNALNIVNYEACHNYTKDLILFILDTFSEMDDEERNKYKLLTVQKKLFQWLFRWRNWSNRKDEDVQSLFSKLRLPFVFNEWPACEIPIRMKLSQVIHHFMLFKEVKTAGWMRDEVLVLLCFAHVYEFGQLFDAVLNLVATQHLEPSSYATIYGLARILESSKLEQVLVDHLKNTTTNIFANYPASVVQLENLASQVMDKETKSLIFTSMSKFRNSNNEIEVQKIFSNIQWQEFIEKLIMDLFINRYKDENSKDVTFVFGEQAIKAHKIVLAYSCDYFKQLFDHNNNNQINMEGTRIEPFQEVIKHCYMQKTDFTNRSYSEKKYLYDLTTKYNYRSLMDLVKTELEKRPKVPLSAVSLNEWYENCPEEVCAFVKNNPLRIVNYLDCHKYSKDLVVLIMDTFCELSDMESDKAKLETPLKKLLWWLFRWRNLTIRKGKEVHSLFAKIRLPLVFKDRAVGDKTLQEKLFVAVRQFCHMREVDTAGWTCDDVLELLSFAQGYEFGPFLDAVVNTVATKYLEPSSVARIYGFARKLQSRKLQNVVGEYLRNNSMSIFTSSEFTNYPANLLRFILENLNDETHDTETEWLFISSIKKWKNANSEKLEKVFDIKKWKNFPEKSLANVSEHLLHDDHSKDVTFVIGEHEIKAHKRVLAYSCNYLKQRIEQNIDNRIKMDETRIEPFTQLINYCYMQTVDFKHLGFRAKQHLYDLATKYNYQSLIDLMKPELEKLPKVPLGVVALNKWYKYGPEETIRAWVKNNLSKIVNYKACYNYSKGLVVLIMDTFYEMSDKETDKEKLEIQEKQLLMWLFRWINSCTRKDEDVQSLFAKIRLPLVFKDRALGDETLQKKLFEAVRRFCHIREVDTAGWTCDDVLELLHFALDYQFGPLVDAVVNTLATQYLEPASLEKIHHLASEQRRIYKLSGQSRCIHNRQCERPSNEHESEESAADLSLELEDIKT